MPETTPLLNQLRDEYLRLHSAKEDLFWATKMGLREDVDTARAEYNSAEQALKTFLQDTARRDEVKQAQQSAEGTAAHALSGWTALFESNTLPSDEAKRLSAEITELEGALEQARIDLATGYIDPDSGEMVSASINKLRLLTTTHEDERVRRATYQGLLEVEKAMLDLGFLDIVKKRNQLARLVGYPNFYAWQLEIAEGMSMDRLFSMLDDLLARTADTNKAALAKLVEEHGERVLEPWNYSHLTMGDLTKKLDPYFGFGPSLRRWGRSFDALGIRYREATLTLDLVDRKGKYENGFMHGPGLSFQDETGFRPARINFTANAIPGAPGSGLRASQTLFHEGGHAAHFSNVTEPAPCFSTEFAPTSVAYAETQSMFLDSLLGDADWRTRYATNEAGESIPIELIDLAIEQTQPRRAMQMRAMTSVPLVERMLYESSDDELTPERVLKQIREIEHNTEGLTSGNRPVLVVPHLLSTESSAYYHAYILALMAVEQTRAFFIERDGHLVDNPKIGPDLAKHYWACGNAKRFDETLISLTGSGLSADALVDACNTSVEDCKARAREAIAKLEDVPAQTGPVALEATIRVIHGRETVMTTEGKTFEAACEEFEAFITKLGEEAAASESASN